jgi:hypothetical protein
MHNFFLFASLCHHHIFASFCLFVRMTFVRGGEEKKPEENSCKLGKMRNLHFGCWIKFPSPVHGHRKGQHCQSSKRNLCQSKFTQNTSNNLILYTTRKGYIFLQRDGESYPKTTSPNRTPTMELSK